HRSQHQRVKEVIRLGVSIERQKKAGQGAVARASPAHRANHEKGEERKPLARSEVQMPAGVGKVVRAKREDDATHESTRQRVRLLARKKESAASGRHEGDRKST